MINPAGRSDSQFNTRYKTVLCRHFEHLGDCRLGDQCQFAHGSGDLRDLSQFGMLPAPTMQMGPPMNGGMGRPQGRNNYGRGGNNNFRGGRGGGNFGDNNGMRRGNYMNKSNYHNQN